MDLLDEIGKRYEIENKDIDFSFNRIENIKDRIRYALEKFYFINSLGINIDRILSLQMQNEKFTLKEILLRCNIPY